MPNSAPDAGRADRDEVALDVLRVTDVDDVIEIERASFATPWTRDQILQQIGDEHHGYNPVVRSGGRPIAYACLRLLEGLAEVHSIAVSPSYRGRGLGARLLRHALLEAARRGCSRAMLEVRPSNVVAQRLYERFGFRRVGFRRGYYQDGEDAWVLAAPLAPVDPDVGEAL